LRGASNKLKCDNKERESEKIFEQKSPVIAKKGSSGDLKIRKEVKEARGHSKATTHQQLTLVQEQSSRDRR
jgi:hypothetical protein